MRTGPTQDPRRSTDVAALRARLLAIEQRAGATRAVSTGWSALDSAFGHAGLACGAVHEWIGLDAGPGGGWSPPLSVLVHLARRCVAAAEAQSASLSVCWIGRSVWPAVSALTTGELLVKSLFVEAGSAGERLWAADLAARCGSVLAVVDGSDMDLAGTRRLQLAAEAGGWMVLLARPPDEAGALSAASTRWRVAREVAPGDQPRFGLRLTRCKDWRSGSTHDRTFILERHAGDRLVLVPPASGHGSDTAKIAG